MRAVTNDRYSGDKCTKGKHVIQVNWYDDGAQANAFLADYNPHDIIKVDFVYAEGKIVVCVMYYTAVKE